MKVIKLFPSMFPPITLTPNAIHTFIPKALSRISFLKDTESLILNSNFSVASVYYLRTSSLHVKRELVKITKHGTNRFSTYFLREIIKNFVYTFPMT